MKRASAILRSTRSLAHPDNIICNAGMAQIHIEKGCSVCGARGVKLKLCGQCKLKYYCSSACQARLYIVYVCYIVHVCGLFTC